VTITLAAQYIEQIGMLKERADWLLLGMIVKAKPLVGRAIGEQ
jgi:hypothetical protein